MVKIKRFSRSTNQSKQINEANFSILFSLSYNIHVFIPQVDLELKKNSCYR